MSDENPKFKIQNSKFEDRRPKREEIAAIVDRFLSGKIAEDQGGNTNSMVNVNLADQTNGNPNGEIGREIQNLKSQIRNSPVSPVKTIIHEIKPPVNGNGGKMAATDFVSEIEVRNAVEKGEKIYISAKTIITPSARDLGEEKDIFAKI